MKRLLCWRVAVEVLLGLCGRYIPSSNLGLIKKLKIKTLKNIKQRKEVEDAKK
nr:MAG TPA: hypothetical protein [Caudoviricetes sp.]